jgi:hypothetical protein
MKIGGRTTYRSQLSHSRYNAHHLEWISGVWRQDERREGQNIVNKIPTGDAATFKLWR